MDSFTGGQIRFKSTIGAKNENWIAYAVRQEDVASQALTIDDSSGQSLRTDPEDAIHPLNSNGNQNQRTPLTLFGVMVSRLAQPNAKFQVSTVLRFSGAQRIAILAYGKTTQLNIEGDWPSA